MAWLMTRLLLLKTLKINWLASHKLFTKEYIFRTLDRPGQTLLTCRTLSADGEGADCEVVLALGISWWWGVEKNEGGFFRKAALGSCLLWDNWVIFLLLFLWFFLRPVSLWQPFWMVLFWLAFLPLLVHLLGNRLWCPSQCCCGAFPPRGWVGWFR